VPVLLEVEVNQIDAGRDNKGNYVPMILFLSQLSLIVENVQLDIEDEVGVVVIIDEPILAILEHKIHDLVVLSAEDDAGFGL
jgi:hypothetical protein